MSEPSALQPRPLPQASADGVLTRLHGEGAKSEDAKSNAVESVLGVVGR